MFLVFGIVTLVVGVAVVCIIPDTPMKSTFLDETEKISLLQHLSENKTGIRNHTFKSKEIREALTDPQVWLFAIATICVRLDLL